MGTIKSSGELSFDDLNVALNQSAGAQIDLDSSATKLNLTKPHSMDEFYGKTYNGPFTFTTAGLTGFRVDPNGGVTAPTATKGSIKSITFASGYSNGYFPVVGSDTTRSAVVVVNIPAGYTNSGTVSGTLTTTQQAAPIFSYSMWTGNVSISSNGVVIYTLGNAAGIGFNTPSSYYTVAVNTQRTINIQLTIPSGYYNAGQQTSPQDVVVTQPPATFTQGDWTGDVSIDKYGSINYSLGNAASFSPSPSSFSEVASSTSRLISVTLGIPSSPNAYTNSGGTITFDLGKVQPPTDEYIRLTDANGNDITNVYNLSGQGTSYTLYVKTSSVWNTSWEISDDSDWAFAPTTTSGQGNGSFVFVLNPNYTGESGYTGNPRSVTITASKVGGGVSDSATLSQDVGTPPAIAPSVSITTPNDIGYNSYGSYNYVTVTGNVSGGTTPSTAELSMDGGGNFAFIAIDSNVEVLNPYGNIWTATANNAGAGQFQVGVYAISNNNSGANKTATITFRASNTAGQNSATSVVTQMFPVVFSISPSSFTIDSNGGNQTISITTSPSSMAWSVSDDQGWITPSSTYGTGTTNINVAIDSYSDTNANRSGTITITPQSGYGLQSTNLSVTQTKAGGGVSTPDYSFSIATDSGDGSCSNYRNGDTFPIYTYIYLGSLQSGQTYYNLDGSTFNGYNSTYSDGSVYGSINSNGYFTYYGDCSSGGGFLTPID